MITMQIFVSPLVIFLINIQVEAIEISFDQIQSVVRYGMNMYNSHQGEKLPDHTQENVVKILEKVNEISDSLDKLDMKMNIKLDRMLNILVSDLEVTTGLEQSKTKLCEYINRVDDFFDNAMIYKFGKSYSIKTLNEFHQSVLWCGDNLPNLLESIYDLFTPGVQSQGFLLMMYRHSQLHITHDCDDHASVQQQMYYTYIQTLIAEMKGLCIIEQIYTTQMLLHKSSHNYTGELEYAKQQYKQRLNKYHEIFSHNMAMLPRQIRRCDINSPERNVNYIEMEQLSRAVFLPSTFIYENGCTVCPDQNALEIHSHSRKTHLDNCIPMGTHVKTCPPERGSVRDYSWWDSGTDIFGFKTQCDQLNDLLPESNCILCVCSEDQNDDISGKKNAILKISTQEKYSDISNNMVVTGIRFVNHNNILHLQIQQANFTMGGIADTASVWLPVIPKPSPITKSGRRKTFFPLLHNCKTMYLDDVAVPDGFAVTGVRFEPVNIPAEAFKLQIHATKFHFNSGVLEPNSGQWVDASSYKVRPQDYKNSRIEIDMGKADNPLRTSRFDYNISSNFKIKFTHTDLKLDGGQTTIPLLDAQVVETRPPFPLGGIGITYKGRKNRGGYIALRIYTIDVTKHMND